MMILTLDTSFNIRVTLRSYAYVLAVQHVDSLVILDLSKKNYLEDRFIADNQSIVQVDCFDK